MSGRAIAGGVSLCCGGAAIREHLLVIEVALARFGNRRKAVRRIIDAHQLEERVTEPKVC